MSEIYYADYVNNGVADMNALMRKTELNLEEVATLAILYDECIIDGDSGKVFFYIAGKFKKSAWIK